MNRVYSNSRLGCFEKCPRQFRYRYVDKLPATTESIEAFLGKRVHEVLERLYRFVSDGMVPPLEAVIRRFRLLWEEQFDAERIRIVRSDSTPETYWSAGKRCLTNHYRRHYPFDGEETVGLEQRVTFSLDEAGKYPMQGIIDRLARGADGGLEIHDFKTSRRLPPQRVLDEDRQLALYELGVRSQYRERGAVRLVWHYLMPDQVRSSHRTEEQLMELREHTIGLIDRIGSETDFEPRPSPLCAWCEYNGICPAATGRPERDAPAPAEALPPPPPEPPSAPPAPGQLTLL